MASRAVGDASASKTNPARPGDYILSSGDPL